MSPRPTLLHWGLTFAYLGLFSIFPTGYADEPEAELLPAQQLPLLKQFRTDFQTDCRSEFQSTGTVDWQPGRVTLQPGAMISKEVNGNWQAEWQFDLACEPVLVGTTAEFIFQVTMNGATPWQLVWQVAPNGTDKSTGTLTLFDTKTALFQVQKEEKAKGTFVNLAGTWQVRYSGGLVQVQHNSQPVLVGYFENYISGLGGGQWQSKQVRLTLTRWQQRSYAPLMLTKTQQQQMQMQQADQLDDKVFRLWRAGQSAEALPLAKQSLQMRCEVYGENHPETALGYFNLGAQHKALACYDEAEPLFQRSVAIHEQTLGRDHPETALSLNELATVYKVQGKYTAAEPLYQRALAIHEQTLGKDHLDTASSLRNLALVYQEQGKYTAAEPLFQRALVIREQILGKDHPETATSLNNLGILYSFLGNYKEAEPLLQRALAIREQTRGKENLDTAQSLNSLADLYNAQGKFSEAELLFQQYLAIIERTLGKVHPQSTITLNNLALLYYDQGNFVAAEPLLQRALAITEQTLGKEHPLTATSLINLAGLYKDQGKYTKAEPLYQRALVITEQTLGREHLGTATALSYLANLYYTQRKNSDAEPLYQRTLAIREQTLGKEHPTTADSLNNLALLYDAQGKHTEAEPLLLQAVQIRELNRARLNDDRLARSQNQNQFLPHHNLTMLYANTQRPLLAWQFWEQSLGRALWDELTSQQFSLLEPKQKQQLQPLQTLCRSYTKILQETTGKPGISPAQREAWQEQLRIYQADWTQLQHDLASQPEQAILAGKAYSLADIQAHLLPHQALVGWFDHMSAHYGLVVRCQGEPQWVQLSGSGPDGQWTDHDTQLAV